MKPPETLDRLPAKKVHVHCAANYRVTAFYSLYEVRRGRWSVERAREFMAGVWQPVEYPTRSPNEATVGMPARAVPDSR